MVSVRWIVITSVFVLCLCGCFLCWYVSKCVGRGGYVPITCGQKEAAGNGPRGTASPVPVFPEQGSYGFLHLWIEAVGSAFFLGVGLVDG